ncbi:MAG: TetR/AcrR family transcriptional regulator [Gemmatimonadota bacterium]
MARPKAFDEDTALEAAAQLFWSYGYDGTSVAELEAGMGMGRQSIYNAFGDKHALFLRSLQWYAEQNRGEFLSLLLAPGAGLEAIRAYFRRVLDFVAPVEERRGCMIANSILEVGESDAPIARVCRANQDGVIGAFEHALRNAVADGDLPASLDVPATARMLLSQTYGLAVLSKSGMTLDELASVVNQLLSRLD